MKEQQRSEIFIITAGDLYEKVDTDNVAVLLAETSLKTGNCFRWYSPSPRNRVAKFVNLGDKSSEKKSLHLYFIKFFETRFLKAT